MFNDTFISITWNYFAIICNNYISMKTGLDKLIVVFMYFYVLSWIISIFTIYGMKSVNLW